MNFHDEVVKLLAEQITLPLEEISNLVVIPPNPALGDFAFPCFKLGKNAKEEAEKLKRKIKLSKFLLKIETAGPYLNFFLNPQFIATETIHKYRYNYIEIFGPANICKVEINYYEKKTEIKKNKNICIYGIFIFIYSLCRPTNIFK